MELPRLTITPRLREMLAYPKFTGPKPRMMIFESQYWLDGACARAAQGLGWGTLLMPVRMEGALSREWFQQWITAIGQFRPDFILSINCSGMDTQGLFARMFEDLEIPFVSWFVDDPRTILMEGHQYASAYTAALTWERGYLPYLKSVGFPLAAYMPLAADVTVFNAEPVDAWTIGPAFVGNSMMHAFPSERQCMETNPLLASAVEAAFAAGRVTRERFIQGLDAVLLPEHWAIMSIEERRHAEIVLFGEGTRRLRTDLAQRLAPEGLTVYGDPAWQTIVPTAQGPVDYHTHLAAFYRHCALNLNTTSLQMATAVNQRVFDCPAAGGFLLTDAQGDLEHLFDADQETARYATIDECVDQFRWFLNRPEARRDIALRARNRILSEHTYAHRLQELAVLLKAQYGTH